MNDQREPVRILVFSASLRAGSLNTRLAGLVADTAVRLGATVDHASMAEFDAPAYNGDVEADTGMPPGAAELHRRLGTVDGFVIVSPEYNASMPGVLKNVIDWVSRAKPQPFDAHHGLLLSASPSMVGGNRGLWSLRIPLEHLGARIHPDMFSLARAHEAFSADGTIADPQLAARFDATIADFLDQVEAAVHYPCVRRAWVEFLGETPDPTVDRVQTRSI